MTQNFLKLPFEANQIISSFTSAFNIIVNILHFHESLNEYTNKQATTLDKTTPIKRGEIRKQAKSLKSSRLWTAGKQVTTE